MSPSRRLLLQAVGLFVAIIVGTALLGRLLGGDPPASLLQRAPQDVAGPVLLVPGYGGSTRALDVLAASLRQAGREATVLPLPGDGTGDLRASAAVLDAAADAAIAAGAPSVDVVGFSAGGVVARLWAKENPGQVRRAVTLGSPHHGTELAGLGAVFAPGACPLACQQLAPGSSLLEELNEDDETPDGPQWLAVWTTQDTVVTPPESARLDGAVNVALQEVCPGLQITHGELPTVPAVRRLVLQALSTEDIAAPRSDVCVSS